MITGSLPDLDPHTCIIIHDDRYFVRPWGFRCSCGAGSANPDKEQAEESMRIHKAVVAERRT